MNKWRQQPAKKAHWSAHFLYVHLELEHMTNAEFLRRSGFAKTTFDRFWKGTVQPRIGELEAMLGVFGYGIKPVPLKEKSHVSSSASSH